VEKIRVVHDGVDPSRARSGDRQRGRQSLGIDDTSVLLLTVATLTDHKGHRYLIEAMRAVVDKSQQRVKLALAGDGELREELARLVSQINLDEHVTFLGFRRDVPDLLKGADLFVLPSHMEGLCSTLIDVMIARMPIITTTAGGIPDLVGRLHGEPEAAVLVPPKDPESLASALLAAIADRDALRPMVDRAEQRALTRFTDEQMVEKTLAIYRELLPR
jgi:glycosyltransferase involved in cell wall biosynthesis